MPAHWELKPLFTLLLETNAKNINEAERNLLSLSYGRVVPKDIESPEGLLPESFKTYQIVDKDDIVLRLTDLQNDQRSLRIGQVPARGIITSAYLNLRTRFNAKPRFLFYQLFSVDTQKVFYNFGGGVRQSMSFADLKRLPLVLPPLAEQELICTFLDRKTSGLDAVIVRKHSLVEALKEKRSALISRTVTRGLPPKVARAARIGTHPKLKPTSVEWLGHVPEHWEIVKVRYIAGRVETGGTPPTIRGDFYEEGTVSWFGPSSFEEQIVLSRPVKLLNQIAVEEGAARVFKVAATLIVTIGATLGKVGALAAEASCNQQITVIEFDETRVYPRFGTYQLKRMEGTLRAIAPSATLPILSQGDVADILMAIPPLPEQRAIADFLDRETAKIDSLVAKVEQAIERLQEYRTALITAAVTGKIDVRQEQSRLGGQSGRGGQNGRTDTPRSAPARKGVHA